MEITVNRRWKKQSYTIGEMEIAGKVFCNTLEDPDRGLTSMMTENEIYRKKIPGITAIPTGRYEVRFTVSPTFKSKTWAVKYAGRVPALVGVKGFSGIRIHPGNSAADTSGCLLLGKNTIKGGLSQSVVTYYQFIDTYLSPAMKRGEKVYITIK